MPVEQWNPCDLHENLLDGVGIFARILYRARANKESNRYPHANYFQYEQLILREATVSMREKLSYNCNNDNKVGCIYAFQ